MASSATVASSDDSLAKTPLSPIGVSHRFSTARLPSLTGLRFVAAFTVFLYHASRRSPNLALLQDKGVAAEFNRWMQPAGALGVSFFFVLSGFILTWSARQNDSAPAFWRRRLVKIYPNYVVTYVLAMVAFAWALTPTWLAVVNFFMLQPWVLGFNNHFSVDPPSWTLGIEALFYALFPLLILLIRRIAPHRLKYWIAGVVAVIIATPAIAYLTLPSKPVLNVGPVSELQYYFVYVFPPGRVLDFALGILVAYAVLSGRWRNIGMVWSSLLLIASYVAAVYLPFLYGQRAICVIPIALLVAAAALADAEGRFTVFRNSVMVWLGNISFAFYLLHFIVLWKVRALLGTPLYSTPMTIAILAGELVLSILLSWALYALVERPMVRRWSSRRGATPSRYTSPAEPTATVP